jgi:hypothetical protein
VFPAVSSLLFCTLDTQLEAYLQLVFVNASNKHDIDFSHGATKSTSKSSNPQTKKPVLKNACGSAYIVMNTVQPILNRVSNPLLERLMHIFPC